MTHKPDVEIEMDKLYDMLQHTAGGMPVLRSEVKRRGLLLTVKRAGGFLNIIVSCHDSELEYNELVAPRDMTEDEAHDIASRAHIAMGNVRKSLTNKEVKATI